MQKSPTKWRAVGTTGRECLECCENEREYQRELISLAIARTKLLHGLPSTSNPMSVSEMCNEKW